MPGSIPASAMRRPSGLRRFLRRNLLATIGLLTIVSAVVVALLAPYLPLADPDSIDTANRLRRPLTPGHPLGTDEFGRDLLARLIWGGRGAVLAGVGPAGGG